MTIQQKAFELGYACAQEALTLKARDLLDKRKPTRIEPALEHIAKQAAPIHPSEARGADWLAKLNSDTAQAGLLSAYNGYRVACENTANVFEVLLADMDSELQGTDQEIGPIVISELARLRNRSESLSDTRAMKARGFDLNHPEEVSRREFEAYDFQRGFANGQMDLLMSAVQGGDYSEEDILRSLLPVMTDLAIPFPLAPPVLSGWEGEFSEAQSEAFEKGIEEIDGAMSALIDAYLIIHLGREVSGLVG